MSASLKLLMILFWFAFSATATAQSSEEDDVQKVFKKMFGSIEVSCDALIVAEFKDPESIFENGYGPSRVDFDPTACAGLLKSTQFATFLQPLFDIMAKWELELPLLEKTLKSETPSDRKKRRAQENYDLGVMQDEVQEGIRPLVSACRQLGRKYNDKNVRVCYFGAPKPSDGLPFQSLFRLMIENAQSPDQTVCAPDPITRGEANVSEFQLFLKPQEVSLSWPEIQKSLLNDGFECRGDGYLAGCRRVLIMLVLAPPPKPDDEQPAIWPSKGGATIIPRQLSVYRGDWQTIGPGYQCEIGPKSKDPDYCKRPERGSANGICTAGEDWHTWGRMIYLLNRDEDSG